MNDEQMKIKRRQGACVWLAVGLLLRVYCHFTEFWEKGVAWPHSLTPHSDWLEARSGTLLTPAPRAPLPWQGALSSAVYLRGLPGGGVHRGPGGSGGAGPAGYKRTEAGRVPQSHRHEQHTSLWNLPRHETCSRDSHETRTRANCVHHLPRSHA